VSLKLALLAFEIVVGQRHAGPKIFSESCKAMANRRRFLAETQSTSLVPFNRIQLTSVKHRIAGAVRI